MTKSVKGPRPSARLETTPTSAPSLPVSSTTRRTPAGGRSAHESRSPSSPFVDGLDLQHEDESPLATLSPVSSDSPLPGRVSGNRTPHPRLTEGEMSISPVVAASGADSVAGYFAQHWDILNPRLPWSPDRTFEGNPVKIEISSKEQPPFGSFNIKVPGPISGQELQASQLPKAAIVIAESVHVAGIQRFSNIRCSPADKEITYSDVHLDTSEGTLGGAIGARGADQVILGENGIARVINPKFVTQPRSPLAEIETAYFQQTATSSEVATATAEYFPGSNPDEPLSLAQTLLALNGDLSSETTVAARNQDLSGADSELFAELEELQEQDRRASAESTPRTRRSPSRSVATTPRAVAHLQSEAGSMAPRSVNVDSEGSVDATAERIFGEYETHLRWVKKTCDSHVGKLREAMGRDDSRGLSAAIHAAQAQLVGVKRSIQTEASSAPDQNYGQYILPLVSASQQELDVAIAAAHTRLEQHEQQRQAQLAAIEEIGSDEGTPRSVSSPIAAADSSRSVGFSESRESVHGEEEAIPSGLRVHVRWVEKTCEREVLRLTAMMGQSDSDALGRAIQHAESQAVGVERKITTEEMTCSDDSYDAVMPVVMNAQKRLGVALKAARLHSVQLRQQATPTPSESSSRAQSPELVGLTRTTSELGAAEIVEAIVQAQENLEVFFQEPTAVWPVRAKVEAHGEARAELERIRGNIATASLTSDEEEVVGDALGQFQLILRNAEENIKENTATRVDNDSHLGLSSTERMERLEAMSQRQEAAAERRDTLTSSRTESVAATLSRLVAGDFEIEPASPLSFRTASGSSELSGLNFDTESASSLSFQTASCSSELGAGEMIIEPASPGEVSPGATDLVEFRALTKAEINSVPVTIQKHVRKVNDLCVKAHERILDAQDAFSEDSPTNFFSKLWTKSRAQKAAELKAAIQGAEEVLAEVAAKTSEFIQQHPESRQAPKHDGWNFVSSLHDGLADTVRVVAHADYQINGQYVWGSYTDD